ncbi:MAG: transketolase [Verrucomicrobiae bacterium]|nr:transketolase [Verrucomicrobiae bacterium]
MTTPSLPELDLTLRRTRLKIIQMSHLAKSAHLASALSCVDLVTLAYTNLLRFDPAHPADPGRDRFILSKGHAVSTLYAALAFRGVFPLGDLDHYNEDGGHLPEQPSPGCAPGVEWATGSLGHGLPVGIGMALAAKIRKQDYRVAVVMSDGECQEGSVWEAALFAPKHGLSHLLAMVDFNKWQATGRSTEIMAMDPLRAKWESFGWACHEIDGHNLSEILGAFSKFPDPHGRPTVIVAHTVKGKGVSFMEDDNNWHYRSPSAEEVEKARVELNLVGDALV